MKTRAWDGKQWRTDFLVDNEGRVYKINMEGVVDTLSEEDVDWKLSRFTGLCDMDNTDVYEHHIVENEFGVRYVVAWDQENCRFISKQPVKAKQTFDDMLRRSYNYPFDDHFVTNVKVVGDIFTTLELLEA